MTFSYSRGIHNAPRGREVTDKAYKHLGKLKVNVQVVCFNSEPIFFLP
jgi:hypothetical protein